VRTRKISNYIKRFAVIAQRIGVGHEMLSVVTRDWSLWM